MKASEQAKMLREMAAPPASRAREYAQRSIASDNAGYVDLARLEKSLAESAASEAAALIAGAEALEENERLLAQMTPEPISQKHKDGSLWLVWSPALGVWVKGRWRFWSWVGTGGTEICDTPTHALPLPPAPEVKNDAQ